MPTIDAGPSTLTTGCRSSTTPAVPGTVLTDRGAVTGSSANGSWGYLGIPYAAPPVGQLRWQPTAPHACWTTPIAATSFGSICMQVDSTNTTQSLGDEDCLTANVWAPATATPTSRLPVMVFIHGGGNVQGSSADQAADGTYLYEGSLLAAHANVVVVTFNYRLGALGFLAHPSFGATSGNYGLDDQLFALGWVQRNAEAFGGDPTRVLLFGQSAGAVDVCALVASPLAKGLFSAALMESGGCVAETAAAAATFAGTFAHTVGCDTAADPAACLRGLTAAAVTLAIPEPADVAAPKQGDYQPNVDGVALTGMPHDVIAAGGHNHVPLVIGSNSNETRRYVPTLASEATYEAATLAYVGGNQAFANQVLALYPISDYGGDPTNAFAALTTDSKFICGARYDARAAAAGQSDEPVYRYLYSHVLDNASAAVKAWGAYHGLELVFVFRHLSIAGYVASAGEDALADAIDGYWSQLATAGEVNGGNNTVTWPAYDVATDSYLDLDDTLAAGQGVRTKYCDFWDAAVGR